MVISLWAVASIVRVLVSCPGKLRHCGATFTVVWKHVCPMTLQSAALFSSEDIIAAEAAIVVQEILRSSQEIDEGDIDSDTTSDGVLSVDGMENANNNMDGIVNLFVSQLSLRSSNPFPVSPSRIKSDSAIGPVAETDKATPVSHSYSTGNICLPELGSHRRISRRSSPRTSPTSGKSPLNTSPDISPIRETFSGKLPLNESPNISPRSATAYKLPIKISPDSSPRSGTADNLPVKTSPDISPRSGTASKLPVKASPDISPRSGAASKLPVKASPDISPRSGTASKLPLRASPDISPRSGTASKLPVKASPDISPISRTADTLPVKISPDISPRSGTADSVPVKTSPDISPRSETISMLRVKTSPDASLRSGTASKLPVQTSSDVSPRNVTASKLPEKTSSVISPRSRTAPRLPPKTSSDISQRSGTASMLLVKTSPDVSPRKETASSINSTFNTSPQLVTYLPDASTPKSESAANSEAYCEQQQQSTPEVFRDPASFDFLSAITSSCSTLRNLRKNSLYVKFDPLVSPIREPEGSLLQLQFDAGDAGPASGSQALAIIDRLLAQSPEEKLFPHGVPEPCLDKGSIMEELQSVRDLLLRQEQAHKEIERQCLAKIGALRQAARDQERRTRPPAQDEGETRRMCAVLQQYEETVARLVADNEELRATHQVAVTGLQDENRQLAEHLSVLELAFSDLHCKFHGSKQVIADLRANQDALREALVGHQAEVARQQRKYDALKTHAVAQLDGANRELDAIRRSHQAERAKLQAQLRKAELAASTLEEALEQKKKESQELVSICDDLISKVGSSK